jgi:hypothetical protein
MLKVLNDKSNNLVGYFNTDHIVYIVGDEKSTTFYFISGYLTCNIPIGDWVLDLKEK